MMNPDVVRVVAAANNCDLFAMVSRIRIPSTSRANRQGDDFGG
jgi:hypothetical protein